MKLSRFKFHAVALGLLCVLLFALCGCGEETQDTPHVTKNFSETVNGIEWTVEYDEETKSITSIAARNGMIFGTPDTYSPFYLFMYDMKGAYCSVVYAMTLFGKPIEGDMFLITQTEEYSASGDKSDFEMIREYFPSCTYRETSHIVYNYDTGETSEVTNGYITFCKFTTEYEMKIVFNNMPT